MKRQNLEIKKAAALVPGSDEKHDKSTRVCGSVALKMMHLSCPCTIFCFTQPSGYLHEKHHARKREAQNRLNTPRLGCLSLIMELMLYLDPPWGPPCLSSWYTCTMLSIVNTFNLQQVGLPGFPARCWLAQRGSFQIAPR